MKKSRFSEQQITFILKQVDEGTSVEEVCRKAGISPQTYYRWRKKYAGLMPSGLRRLKQLEDENSSLMTISGFGPTISTAMVAAVGTGEAFDRGRDFAAWLGLPPRQYRTGGKPVLRRISKQGSKYVRNLFIQADLVILMRPHNWKLFSFGPWLE